MPRKSRPDAAPGGSARATPGTRSAYDRALGMLARREYSERELRTRLQHAGCDEADSRTAIGKLREERYQDDARFGGMVVRARVGQGYGPARIRAELRSHGLEERAIAGLLDAADANWESLARAQLAKKYAGKRPAGHADRAKRAAFLMRRGFDAETVRIVTHSEGNDPRD